MFQQGHFVSLSLTKNKGAEKKTCSNYLPLLKSAILFPIVLNLAKNGAINIVTAGHSGQSVF
jgi:hypothetical protein